jgi:serine/threonine protein kinase
VLLDGELHGKLGDFRLARCSKHEQDFQTTHEAGTLGYIARELPGRDKPTPRTDIYAFGALCSEVACGRRLVGQKKPLRKG